MKRYEVYAESIAQRIRSGSLKPGDRLPSVREARGQQGLSASTIFSAYYLLETQGLVEARARSGYYVLSRAGRSEPEPAASEPLSHSMAVDVSALVFQVLAQARQRELVPLGSAFPSPTLFPLEALARGMGRAMRAMDPWRTVEDMSPGNGELRHQISLRYGLAGIDVPPSEIVVSNGAMEALNLCLEVSTQPGDVVAIETPCFYAALQALERRGLRAVEVETHPRTGVDLDSLQRVLAQHPVKACWLMPTFQNPMGGTMPDQAKASLVEMLSARRIPLIEDDVYGELHHGPRRPPPAKAWDREGWVMHCSSFSKSLAPGYRVGWVAGGRFATALGRHKLMSSLAAAMPSQLALQEFLQQNSFDRHLRSLRHALSRQQASALRVIAREFPAGTRVTRPEGGYFLWVELPAAVDALDVHRRAMACGVGVAPGHLFSADRRYRHHLRINHGYPGDTRFEAALCSLGRIVSELALM
ncbi:PLP-dependent aminotransferase family protein [Roseateles cavernae]|uniref:aminotransferase-like domain-containing protein n=1 Tax=Roseateles cavernae TaxID=3153578 RepID=UPI0032E3A11A